MPPAARPLKLEIIRPDDLLHLQFELTNMSLDASDASNPQFVISDPNKSAFLGVIFPPQTITETAYFEYSIVPPDAPTNPDKGKSASDNEPLDPPGVTGPKRHAVAKLAHSSRLVFSVPPGVRIPFSTNGLLDWSNLVLHVNPIAAIGSSPTSQQIANAPDIQEPASNETAIELPYRLVISPTSDVAWKHRANPFTHQGRTELWHTRLMLKTADGILEPNQNKGATLRAIWSPDFNSFNPPPTTQKDPDLNLTAMSPNDRHQIVILTSAFHGYEVDKIFKINLPAGGPGRFDFIDRGQLVEFTVTVSYVPQPFVAEQLMLSSFGGWLRSRGFWSPPRTVAPVVGRQGIGILVDAVHGLNFEGRNLPPVGEANVVNEVNLARLRRARETLDLSEWVHHASQGRDHYVRIVYEGELWPFRHRAALVKV
ncbi:MAG TPA: hypothetical protein VKC60_13280, partial [Opitutaceae bacterium]|nr:hypothetical protein [Opitutaceae bacterium]